MMRLTTSVVAEPFVPTSLPALWMRSGERDHSPAVLAVEEILPLDRVLKAEQKAPSFEVLLKVGGSDSNR